MRGTELAKYFAGAVVVTAVAYGALENNTSRQVNSGSNSPVSRGFTPAESLVGIEVTPSTIRSEIGHYALSVDGTVIPVSVTPIRIALMLAQTSLGVVSEGTASNQAGLGISGDPAVDSQYDIANCLRPGFQAPTIDQSLTQSVISRVTSLFFSVAEATPEYKTNAEIVACLNSNPLLEDFVLLHKGVNLKNAKESDVIGESTYKDLPQYLAGKKLMTLDQAKAMFGPVIVMTYKVGDVITSGNATMLDNEAEVARRRAPKIKDGNVVAPGEKMIFWTGESYEVVVINGVTLVFRQDCANILLPEAPRVVEETSSSTPEKPKTVATPVVALTPIPKAPDTATPINTAPATATPISTPTSTSVESTNTPTKVPPTTPTSAPTNTETLPTKTPGVTPSLVATRTPGAPSPTAIGTPDNTPVVTASNTPPTTPTSAPTNTETLPTKTPGVTPSLVATRTPNPDAPTPTAIGNRPSPTVSGGGVPPSPTAAKP